MGTNTLFDSRKNKGGEMNEPQKSFVFDGVEVVKTGRQAKRTIPSVGKGEPRVFTIYEIVPKDDPDGWKKWVKMDDLWEIV